MGDGVFTDWYVVSIGAYAMLFFVATFKLILVFRTNVEYDGDVVTASPSTRGNLGAGVDPTPLMRSDSGSQRNGRNYQPGAYYSNKGRRGTSDPEPPAHLAVPVSAAARRKRTSDASERLLARERIMRLHTRTTAHLLRRILMGIFVMIIARCLLSFLLYSILLNGNYNTLANPVKSGTSPTPSPNNNNVATNNLNSVHVPDPLFVRSHWFRRHTLRFLLDLLGTHQPSTFPHATHYTAPPKHPRYQNPIYSTARYVTCAFPRVHLPILQVCLYWLVECEESARVRVSENTNTVKNFTLCANIFNYVLAGALSFTGSTCARLSVCMCVPRACQPHRRWS